MLFRSLLDIINEIHNIMISDLSSKKLDINKFKNIIMNLKNLENNTLISTSEKILISNFVSCFF